MRLKNGYGIVYLNLIANRSIFHVNSVHAPIHQMQMYSSGTTDLYVLPIRWSKMHNSLRLMCECMRRCSFHDVTLFCGMQYFGSRCPNRKLMQVERLTESRAERTRRQRKRERLNRISTLKSISGASKTAGKHTTNMAQSTNFQSYSGSKPKQ